MKKEVSLGLCMIVKNEEQFLSKCIESVKDIVSEIIIVDTGSSDSTTAIAKDYTDFVYSYEWANDFSAARNFSLQKSTCDWVLVLDADEILEPTDKDKLLPLIQDSKEDGYDFRIHNYSTLHTKEDYLIHYALRLIRRDAKFAYKGVVHEQYVCVNALDTSPRTKPVDIILHHYGYTNDIVTAKKKRMRNIPLIEKELEKNPENPYYLFSLGNEFLAQNDYKKAFSLYQKTIQRAKETYVYIPFTYYRLITCAYSLRNLSLALTLCEEAIQRFPACIDYMFLKGVIYRAWHQPLLAVDCFKQCLQMNSPPHYLSITSETNSMKPLVNLAYIYYEANDYQQALTYFLQIQKLHPKQYAFLYPITHCYKKIYREEEKIVHSLKSSSFYQANTNFITLLSDIFLEEELYSAAKEELILLKDKPNEYEDYLYLTAKLNFYEKNFEDSYESFTKLLSLPLSKNSLQHVTEYSFTYLFLIALLTKQDTLLPLLEQIKETSNTTLYEVCFDLYDIVILRHTLLETYTSNVKSADEKLEVCLRFLDNTLRIKEFDLFEQLLPVLNRMDSTRVLLELAKLYQKYNYKDMASKTILKSIKELDTFDFDGLSLLATNLSNIE